MYLTFRFTYESSKISYHDQMCLSQKKLTCCGAYIKEQIFYQKSLKNKKNRKYLQKTIN